MSRLRVVIADDQPLMRAGFKAVLEATGAIEIVAEAGDGAEAIAAAEAHRPDVVLMTSACRASTASRRRAACRATGSSCSRRSASTSTSSRRCARGRAAS